MRDESLEKLLNHMLVSFRVPDAINNTSQATATALALYVVHGINSTVAHYWALNPVKLLLGALQTL